MAQHFILCRAVRAVSLTQVARMSDDATWDVLEAICRADDEGAP